MQAMQESRNVFYQYPISAKEKPMYCACKRIADLLFGLVGLPIFAVIYIAVAVLIKAEDGGPVLYKGERIGHDGKPFAMYKFRTMRPNADQMERFLTPEEIAEYKEEFKLPKDCRITRVGSWLRKTSLDELPQILNVLKNDMSLIGPRPIIAEEVSMYGNDRELFLSIKPGITGYWQAYARNDVGYTDGRRQKMELYYIHNRSVLLDVKILLATVKRVLLGKGAM